MTAQKMSAQEIIAFIGNAEKKTNVKVTFEGELATAVPASVTKLGNVLFGDWKDIEPLLANLTENKDHLVPQHSPCFQSNSQEVVRYLSSLRKEHYDA